MTFKEKLVILRKIKGITQEEFAIAVGVSRQSVYKWEAGRSYPEVAKLLEIKPYYDAVDSVNAADGESIIETLKDNQNYFEIDDKSFGTGLDLADHNATFQGGTDQPVDYADGETINRTEREDQKTAIYQLTGQSRTVDGFHHPGQKGN